MPQSSPLSDDGLSVEERLNQSVANQDVPNQDAPSQDVPSQDVAKTSLNSSDNPPAPLRSLTGALMAAAIGLLMYRLTTSIVLSFSAHPIVSQNRIVLSLSAAIRTLVIGLATMATGIFAFVTLGLVALAIQAMIQAVRTPKAES
ncbi:MAG: DUF3082 domain-containing protein [Thermosynechococcaceae cyanobacterium MS004]|nr:DUF3082 domain-containing protein [Thermosynechococcaceae cyanobacterium MS004]